jgi:TatD DNase family protein
VHSAGRTNRVLDLIANDPHPGIILHWFLGSPEEIDRAVLLGCHFSVNAAMSEEAISRIPAHKMLPETDFPSSRSKTRARTPGDTDRLDLTIAALRGISTMEVRDLWYRNFSALVRAANVTSRLSTELQDVIAQMH